MPMKIEAYAKVNYTLEVLGKRPDGYHALRSFVVPVSLSDTLTINATADGELSSDTGYPDDLCLKAARVLRDAAGCSTRGARICVLKRIPAGGGLGGGSADAAATLLALNELWSCGFSRAELLDLGARVGSDVPALVLSRFVGPVLMKGRGEIVFPVYASLAEVPVHHLVLAYPGVFCSTAEVFSRSLPRTGTTELWNDLEAPAIALHPEMSEVKAALLAAGARDVRMTGSGSTFFGFASDETTARAIVEKMRARGWSAWAVTGGWLSRLDSNKV